jgi:hypothetical protein
MMPDRVMVKAGLVDVGQMTDEARSVLFDNVVRMRLAGVTLSLAEWESLSTETQAAFVAAGKAIYEHMAKPATTEVPPPKP